MKHMLPLLRRGKRTWLVGSSPMLVEIFTLIWMLAASPWFFTHYGPEVSYSKNWVFPGDLLWYLRWREILSLKPSFVEIVTWNE